MFNQQLKKNLNFNSVFLSCFRVVCEFGKKLEIQFFHFFLSFGLCGKSVFLSHIAHHKQRPRESCFKSPSTLPGFSNIWDYEKPKFRMRAEQKQRPTKYNNAEFIISRAGETGPRRCQI